MIRLTTKREEMENKLIRHYIGAHPYSYRQLVFIPLNLRSGSSIRRLPFSNQNLIITEFSSLEIILPFTPNDDMSMCTSSSVEIDCGGIGNLSIEFHSTSWLKKWSRFRAINLFHPIFVRIWKRETPNFSLSCINITERLIALFQNGI